MRRAALLLLVVGLSRMAGDVLDLWWLAGLGAATAAAPAPKVFTTVGDMEPFSTRFYLEWEGADGVGTELAITPAVYARLEGPYNRRNAYGAVLAAGPALCADPLTRDLAQSVAEHALSSGSPIRHELGVEAASGLRVRYEPVAATMESLPARLAPRECGAVTLAATTRDDLEMPRGRE